MKPKLVTWYPKGCYWDAKGSNTHFIILQCCSLHIYFILFLWSPIYFFVIVLCVVNLASMSLSWSFFVTLITVFNEKLLLTQVLEVLQNGTCSSDISHSGTVSVRAGRHHCFPSSYRHQVTKIMRKRRAWTDLRCKKFRSQIGNHER